ncbi:MAG: aminotransferase class V-fold PLP-dependent enzyme [Pseudomonadota bacterium]
MSRVYLDWNATAPLRPEARAAMIAAMDVVGNPSSVHAEGRAAKALMEKARGQVADLVGCEPSEIVFTSGATEAASLIVRDLSQGFVHVSPVEHDCFANADTLSTLAVSCSGLLNTAAAWSVDKGGAPRRGDLIVLPCANSETGIRDDTLALARSFRSGRGAYIATDMTQAAAKTEVYFSSIRVDAAAMSSHKIGGPKGVGALLVLSHLDLHSSGGGQEMGRRSGTENVIGIAGFGAAAEAARRDLEGGVWERVAELRNILETALEAEADDLIIFGKDVARLPNTSCFAIPGWKGETQVMQMDLAGYAVSAGSACSSGKVKESRVLRAMGFDSVTAFSAIRVSLGPTTTEAEVLGFIDAWVGAYRRWKARAA